MREPASRVRVSFARDDAPPPTAGLPPAAEAPGDLKEFSSLCLDSFRASQMLAREDKGHERTIRFFGPQRGKRLRENAAAQFIPPAI